MQILTFGKELKDGRWGPGDGPIVVKESLGLAFHSEATNSTAKQSRPIRGSPLAVWAQVPKEAAERDPYLL